ncbi:MAG: aldo/keto reductase [Thomasclavelia ramosa]|nr:aldo/keto reductase [Thomasclavelia ramosa]
MQYLTLNNGLKIPILGFGTMNIFDVDECTKVLKDAYESGYRLFDCAQIYGNEGIVGEALQNAGIPRHDIFITTKVWFTEFEGDNVRQSLLTSMKKLKTDYLDLVLIHWPYGNTYHAYRELEKMYEEGLIKSIGVSNYQESQLIDFIHFNRVVPVVNQIKTTMRCQRKQLHQIMNEKGVIMQGYQVFGKEETLSVYEDKKVKDMALKYGKSVRQIAMRFLMQNGISVITRPMEKQWMEDNLNLFDFELTDDEMNYLAQFDMLEYNTKPSQDYKRTVSMLEK